MIHKLSSVIGLALILFTSLLTVCGCKSNSQNSSKQEDKDTIAVENDKIVVITDQFIEKISKYDYIEGFSEGFSRVSRNDKEGFIDTKGDEVIPCKFKLVSQFKNGVATVRTDSSNNKVGVINTKGEVVIPCVYDYIFGISDGLVGASKKDNLGFINLKGETIIPFIYNLAENFSEGMALVEQDDKWGFVNKEGEQVVIPIYDYAKSFSDSLASVKKDGKWGVINNSGEIVIPFTYSNIKNFSDGLAPAEVDNKWGYINKKGEKVIPFIYDNAWEFNDGLAMVNKDNKSGYINTQGQEIVPLKYSAGGSFSNGMASVCINYGYDGEMDNHYGFVNKKGEEVIPCMYQNESEEFCEGLTAVMKDGKWGYINSHNETVIPFIYDYASNFSNGVAKVEKNGIYGFVDKNGKDTFYGEEYARKAEQKVKEEEQQIAEERRIEQEEREKEANPSIVFNEMVNDYAWVCTGTMDTYQGQTHRVEEVEQILIFYPSDEESGRVARIRWADNRRTYYPQFSTTSAKYKIKSNFVYISNYSRSMVERDDELPFHMVYRDGILRLDFATNQYMPIPKTADLIPENLNH